jgi:hypothetical protein
MHAHINIHEKTTLSTEPMQKQTMAGKYCESCVSQSVSNVYFETLEAKVLLDGNIPDVLCLFLLFIR